MQLPPRKTIATILNSKNIVKTSFSSRALKKKYQPHDFMAIINKFKAGNIYTYTRDYSILHVSPFYC